MHISSKTHICVLLLLDLFFVSKLNNNIIIMNWIDLNIARTIILILKGDLVVCRATTLNNSLEYMTKQKRLCLNLRPVLISLSIVSPKPIEYEFILRVQLINLFTQLL